jgi:DNA-binding FrmR family transcriptional regulator
MMPASTARDAGRSTASHGYSDQREEYQRRLRRIEGQVRGLQGMVDEDRYCIDILTQISAATRALQEVAIGLLDGHLRHCVREAVQAGGPEADAKVAEASAAVARLVRS